MKAKEIARLLGVSPSTVSMAINNRPGVSAARRQEIIEKINQLGCSGLLSKESSSERNIGFIVYKNSGDILGESPFFTLLMEGVGKAVRENGGNLMFMQIVKDGPIQDQKRIISANNCRGFIIFATEAFENDMAFFHALKLPFVILDNDFSEEGANTVCINNRQGVLLAIRHLRKLGHRNIGYLRSKSEINSFTARFDAFCAHMARLELAVRPENVVNLSYSEQGACGDIADYLRGNPMLPTAFLADNDLLAYWAVKAFQEAGLSVPGDVSVVGFDDRPICTMSEPALTTVAVPRDVFGPAAVELLMKQLDNPESGSIKIEVGVRLIQRESTAKRKKE